MELEESKGDVDLLNEPFNEATTLTHIAGSVSGRDLLDLRQEFTKEMQEQVKALHDVQSVLLRFEAVMESVAHGLASQRNLLEGVGLNAHAGNGRSRKSSLDSVMEGEDTWKSKANLSEGDDEVWAPEAPSAPQSQPPSLPSMVKEESKEGSKEDCSPHSILQNVSLSVLSQFGTGNHGGTLLSVTPQGVGVSRQISERRRSDPCLSRSRKPEFMVARLSNHSECHSKSSGIQSRGLIGMTEEIEGITACRIMRNGGKTKSGGRQGSRSGSATSKKPETNNPEESAPASPKKHLTVDVTGFGRRMSMDELRTKCDEVLVRSSTQAKFVSCDQLSAGPKTALSPAARAILCFSGILDFRLGRFWQTVSWFNFAVVPLVLAILVEVETNVLGEDQYMPNTMMALTLGGVLSIGNLRWVGLGNLLGPAEHSLDDFAVESGFMEDWQLVSRKRSLEVLCVLFFMVLCRLGSNLCFPSDLHYGRSITGRISDILMDVVFLCVSFRCAALTFCQLHICSGLELSIDSFCLKFFREMDIEQAIQEWNMVQANLRKVSNECSGSFFLTAAACFASMLLLAERILQDPTIMQDWRQITLWLGWLYPPTLFFFYAMLRAAAVTEKASRVGPLVNSWNLQESDDAPSVDVDRQYVVQYINQSQAGFFMKGVRITGFEVQKMMYYFAALTFTLVSRTFNR